MLILTVQISHLTLANRWEQTANTAQEAVSGLTARLISDRHAGHLAS